ncbi:hypothetical protein ATI61_107347 [Archangium gephyra]|uniref:Uncharacterized protein n=1 Tax=Archangium gephyra TaxID=48 RepID=A0AAC8TJ15_9BACT|nr:hypothetical protein [Archangium gephyra]AKJ07903.1 Hypothetical protein AA314_09529 [Archangium gephyra]REG29651.1 hypothetical protein ATI61_107347 [Archangium gephyra]
MIPRHTSSRPGRLGLVLGALGTLLGSTQALAFNHSGNARLLASDEAAAIKKPVLGLQRSAVPLAFGFALDTSVLADIALAPNLGVRWGLEVGPHRFVVGARYTKFLGNQILSDFVSSQQPAVKKFEIDFQGPSAYALYGLQLGPVLVQGEVRHWRYQTNTTTASGALVVNFAGNWSVVGEFGVRLQEGLPLRGAAGLRYAGENFGFSLGAAYVDVNEPLVPVNEGRFPILPTLDLSWTFR